MRNSLVPFTASAATALVAGMAPTYPTKDRMKFRTGMVAGLIALGLASFGTAPVYAAGKTPLTKAENMNLCLLIGSGCIKNCTDEQCIDFCMREESECYARARIAVIGGQVTIGTVGGGGVATQGP